MANLGNIGMMGAGADGAPMAPGGGAHALLASRIVAPLTNVLGIAAVGVVGNPKPIIFRVASFVSVFSVDPA